MISAIILPKKSWYSPGPRPSSSKSRKADVTSDVSTSMAHQNDTVESGDALARLIGRVRAPYVPWLQVIPGRPHRLDWSQMAHCSRSMGSRSQALRTALLLKPKRMEHPRLRAMPLEPSSLRNFLYRGRSGVAEDSTLKRTHWGSTRLYGNLSYGFETLPQTCRPRIAAE